MEDLHKQAIKAALNHDWDTAIKINKSILKKDKKDVSSLLRLANAYFSKCEMQTAIKYALKASKIDPDNKLAKKFIEKCELGKEAKPRSVTGVSNLKAFSNNYGQTKIIKLINLGKPSLLASLIPGESLCVTLSPQKSNVETNDGLHIGSFPDDITTSLWTEREKKHQVIFKSFDKNTAFVLLV